MDVQRKYTLAHDHFKSPTHLGAAVFFFFAAGGAGEAATPPPPDMPSAVPVSAPSMAPSAGPSGFESERLRATRRLVMLPEAGETSVYSYLVAELRGPIASTLSTLEGGLSTMPANKPGCSSGYNTTHDRPAESQIKKCAKTVRRPGYCLGVLAISARYHFHVYGGQIFENAVVKGSAQRLGLRRVCH